MHVTTRAYTLEVAGTRKPFLVPKRTLILTDYERKCNQMVNTRFNGVRPIAPVHAPAEESAARGRGRGVRKANACSQANSVRYARLYRHAMKWGFWNSLISSLFRASRFGRDFCRHGGAVVVG
uniref:Uncharacterized protein n=1 Tax=Solanum tuberosum TaxID=4113 RepID=M1DQV5_SOLTU